ncbi:MAG: hypothetical protein O3A84_10610 [Proteobacteria bacterium]|nr:hypothetical protein [Pseudomonadota bacterium]
MKQLNPLAPLRFLFSSAFPGGAEKIPGIVLEDNGSGRKMWKQIAENGEIDDGWQYSLSNSLPLAGMI